MEELNDKITIQCSHCQRMVHTRISHIKADKCLSCPYCFTNTEIDVDKFLENLELLMKKVEEYKKGG